MSIRPAGLIVTPGAVPSKAVQTGSTGLSGLPINTRRRPVWFGPATGAAGNRWTGRALRQPGRSGQGEWRL